MDLKQYDVQNFYPRYLDQDELNRPLKVISDFFSADWLTGHLESLLEWRKHVIEEGYYTDEHKKSPAGLLFTHQLNARLVEAVYLISRTKRALKLADAIHINFDLLSELILAPNCPEKTLNKKQFEVLSAEKGFHTAVHISSIESFRKN